MTSDIWCLKGELRQEDSAKLETILEQMAEERGVFPPTLSMFEQAPDEPWVIEVFFPEAPESGFVEEVIERMGGSDWVESFEPVEEKDWVAESQKLLQPVEAGRFFVFGSHDADKARPDAINLLIDAGQAFGTGKHETTSACLDVLDELADSLTPKTMLDLGTGSGVLALAAQKVWPSLEIVASDIDPIAIDVTVENVEINKGVARTAGTRGAGIACIVAPGLDDPAFKDEGPFDLICANILAGPLITLAPDITGVLASGGTLVLSGLLVTQEKEVLAPYEAQGLDTQGRVEKGEWLALVLRKP
ncbi:50S ribosomal protein L11 methyltransferase [Kordiimonas marina]|uniref:50S ribosomal protein L11 methyltransferase n=1 Tax=Kordiimonas marina TaxID=2872312 RepID=UPI001FF16A59|nr:50S ribosomal protein L11 methyltransferase [Kordiimonas marina]MCJ9427499.1 50S ribosomal protein L11 methyltransferase [Kordiimonas marina]